MWQPKFQVKPTPLGNMVSVSIIDYYFVSPDINIIVIVDYESSA